MNTAISEKVRKIIQKVLILSDEDMEKLKNEDSLEDIGLNSVILLQFIVQLEQDFDIEINEDDIDTANFGSMIAITQYIENMNK